MRILVVAVLLLAGCEKATDTDPCGTGVNASIDRMITQREQQPAMREIGKRLRGILLQHCRDDRWPADVIACFKAASDQPSMKKCRQQLPPDMAQKLQADIIEAMTPPELGQSSPGSQGGDGSGR